MDSVIVYYSFGGNCALAAQALAEATGGQLVALQEVKPRGTDNGAVMRGAMAALFGRCSKLVGTPWDELGDAKVVHLLTPIWASRPAPAVHSFLRHASLAGREVVLYTVQADPSAAAPKAVDLLRRWVAARGGTVRAVHGLVGASIGVPPRQELADEIRALQ